MPHEYTRQRQGRDFPTNNDDVKDDAERKKSMLEHLERCAAESERSAVPVDGKEPPQEASRKGVR